jgi:MFS family permease
VLGAFFYGYTFTQILGGLAARRFGGRNVLVVGVALWSLFTILTPAAAAAGMPQLLLCRVLMGLGEGVTMPASHAMIGEWLPPHERTRSVAVATSGQFLGQHLSSISRTFNKKCRIRP